ncbi:MAG: arylsulfatase [Thermoguttaceae bacterium]
MTRQSEILKRRAKIVAIVALTVTMLAGRSVTADDTAAKAADKVLKRDRHGDKPNIVLIMADDMGWSDAGCYGGEIQTPNLDRLARDGLRFTQFYNCAMCTTTRASLIYGVYPQQAGARKVKHCISLAEALKTAGYRTLMTGKWHGSQNPVARGFDRYYGLLSGCCNYFNPGKQRPGEAKPAHKRPADFRPWGEDGKVIRVFTPEDPDFYTTDAFTDRALEYLDKYGREDRPFFLYLAYTAPHFPIQAPAEDIARYRGKYKVGWDVIRQQRYGRQKKMGLIDAKWPLSPRDSGDPLRIKWPGYNCAECVPWEEVNNPGQWDLMMAVYAAMIDRMDRNIGRILDKLRELDEENNTLVLFLSDNGACAESIHPTPDVPPGSVDSYHTVDLPWANASNTPFRKFKMCTYEGGIATPLIVRWPTTIKRGGTITTEVGHVMDILPTLCEIAGIEYPGEYKGQKIIPSEGKSLVPVFQGKQRDGHDWLFWENAGTKAVRHGKWKLVGYDDPTDLNNWNLYDLQTDRTELKNLAKQYPERLKQMAQAWRDWAKRTGQP